MLAVGCEIGDAPMGIELVIRSDHSPGLGIEGVRMSHESDEARESDGLLPGGFLPSPVPLDQFLDEGELPFTAFGQFGPNKMDNRVFDQDVWWVDRNGDPHALEDMSPEYRWNVIAFLMERAEYCHVQAMLKMVVEVVLAERDGRIHPDLLVVGVGGATVADLDSVAWLETTPLMRKLRALTASH